MPAESQDERELTQPMREFFDAARGADHIAAQQVALWQSFDATLTPVIGKRGVAALYARSLHLAARNHAWMLAGHDPAQASFHPTALRDATALQSADEAAAGALALRTAFHGLLASLVGPTLTDRMLQGLWQPKMGNTPAQDIKK